MKIPVYFLGTGQAIPTKKRNHTAMLLKYKGENILIDCGEVTQRQFRKARLNPFKITRILLTHLHGDHVLGLPGLFQTLALNEYNKTLHIYGPKGTKKLINLLKKLFVHREEIEIEVKEINTGQVFETEDFEIKSKKMKHGTPCLAYSFKEKDKLRIDKKKLEKLNLPNSPKISKLKEGKDIEHRGKKIKSKNLTYEEEGKKITFIMDTMINPRMEKIAKDSNLLVTESTYTEEEKDLAKERKHLTAKQAAKTAKKAKVKKLILTHISQRYENKEDLVLSEAKKVFKNTSIAEDLDKVEV